jgi:polyisoprenoid-binding protein YceI
MPTSLAASPAHVLRVFTYKEGLLSTVAHDLRLTLGRWHIDVDDAGSVKGSFFPATLKVDGVMRVGQVDADALSGSNQREIMATVNEKLLQTGRHPEATLVGRVVGEDMRRQFEGTLTLVGRAASITAPVEVTDAFVRVSLELQPTRWGITPYKALMGAIRLQDRVRITLDAPR